MIWDSSMNAGRIPAKGLPDRLIVAALVVLSAAFATLTSAARSRPERTPTGELTPLPGASGCINGKGSHGCGRGVSLVGASDAAVSPDGRSVYIASYEGSAIAVFARDPATGALRQLDGTSGCVSYERVGACAQGRALHGALDIAVSPDGRNVYVAAAPESEGAGGVAVFARDPATGALRQLDGTSGCVSGPGQACAPARALRGAYQLSVSPDGRSVYVDSQLSTDELSNANHHIVAFAREPTTGALRQLDGRDGCFTGGRSALCTHGRGIAGVNGMAISPDGRNFYIAAGRGALAVYARDPGTGVLRQLAGRHGCISAERGQGCGHDRLIESPAGVAVSPDGRTVYMTDEGDPEKITVMVRNTTTGSLSQLAGAGGCAAYGGGHGCGQGRGVFAPWELAVSPDGRNVYVESDTGLGEIAISIFARHRSTGALRQLDGRKGCLGGDERGCAGIRGLAVYLSGIAISPDGTSVYIPSDDLVVLARH
jgi:DNA-binding beta-propeller fold protein YncE